MKKFGKLIAPLALLLTSPACAQNAPAPVVRDADPALWVVKDADTTIYLFGTIHVLQPGMKWFDGGVKKAFDSSDQVVLEILTPDAETMQAIVKEKGFAHDGKALTERLPADKRAAYGKALASLGLPATAFDPLEPWFAATNLELIPLQKLGYDLSNGPEQIITKASNAAGKKLTALETAQQQLGFFDGLSMPAQIAFLSSTVDEMPTLEHSVTEMVDDWAKGDPDALGKLLNDDLTSSPEIEKVLLVDRNKNWAEWIDQRMKQPGVVFMAVGAGHLAGKNSVLVQLKAHHLTARRVKY
ncbi:TraB/GumN family protein [Sphingomonas oligophenolica]|uniref:TraB/GumN family protein n=1 Tax=Sphingomonas oligophenolica TaxID=301154 RepID=A0ABU9XZ12_9SPHN